ncbi:hypothetical protein [Arcticibacterium luteifluviistationis]|uniref:Uncharacterized protein n=1 Tax=Arcticibacterium luteifluviistationis TaxID=1784714 RepID=A0A2Z4G9H3_9BACT|nr:hypothetical protein [Arcticibacterium luteifluviistationis]AWV97879.1 hypothetical protein DJ013_06740 [Arcticibacterium luteifluviistationis]
MQNNKENWKNKVLTSMKDSTSAKPRPELFDLIKGKIDKPKAKVISLTQWRMIAAVAATLIFINSYALYTYAQNDNLNTSQTTDSSLQLISDYNIY